jgi:hypothetical protein
MSSLLDYLRFAGLLTRKRKPDRQTTAAEKPINAHVPPSRLKRGDQIVFLNGRVYFERSRL